jgi:exodeoxyribonuclease V gamma subunit
MLRLVYSNRAEELIAELSARVRAQQAGPDVLVPVTVVVPNATVEEYLRFGIARECGVAANLQMMRITAFAAQSVTQAAGAAVAGVAGADTLEAMALTLLLDESFLGRPELAPVRAYIAAGESVEAGHVRRVQLAASVGRLFEEYTYSRAEMLAAWSDGTSFDGQPARAPDDRVTGAPFGRAPDGRVAGAPFGRAPDGRVAGAPFGRAPEGTGGAGVNRHADTEPWQRSMWLAMFGEGGLARRRGLVPLHEAIGALEDCAASAPTPVHVFGFAHFARAFHRLLARVARVKDVVIYSLSPCDGFWEDVDPGEPPLLRLWARPGREHVRALNEGANFDHDDRFVEPAGTLLAQLQRDMLRREPARERVDASSAFDSDESIAVLEHASVRRELEAVASEIWRLVERDETLRFDDFAVLLPDDEASSYLAHLTAVFREGHDIPHRLVDMPAGGNAIGEAVELLLRLPIGRFTRQELLRLAVHPAVIASLEDVDPERWLQWCDELGIVHGADRADHEDTYIGRDIFNWDQGLKRLALGAFMAGDASGERRPFELDEESYVPCEVAASQSRDAAAFGLLVRSLVADARFVQRAELSIKDWAALLCVLVETYVAPMSDADVEPLTNCLRRIQSIAQVDIGDARVPYRVARELARSRIASQGRARGIEGVFVSRVVSARPIPFRVVFACGMGEGRFPSSDAEDPLDLRWMRRYAGDVTARERDKYAFLELMLGTRDRLYLSYISRDPLTGDKLAPSSVILELLHTLERGYVRDVSALRRRHPLRRWDARYFPELYPAASAARPQGAAATKPSTGAAAPLGTMRFPEARAEARTLALRQNAEAHGVRVKPDDLDVRAAHDPAWARLAEHLRVTPLPEVAAAAAAKLVIPMYALIKFLEFPLHGWARFQVGLDELDEEDPLAREDEPFETQTRDETLLLREVLFAAKNGGSLERAYDEAVRERELRGSGPSGVFARGERAAHLGTLEGWKERLDALDIRLDEVELHRFGRSGEHASASRAHPPLSIDVDFEDSAGVVRVARVEIGGRTLPLERRTSITLSRTLSRRPKDNRDDWVRADRQRAALRAFVDYAVLCASGVEEGGPHTSVQLVWAPEGTFEERAVFEGMSRGEATQWLRGLVRELLSGPHAYFLPCEAIFVWHRKTPDGPVEPWLEAAREMLRDGEGALALRSAYGPVPRPHEYPIVEEETARAMIVRRYGALLDRTRWGEA